MAKSKNPLASSPATVSAPGRKAPDVSTLGTASTNPQQAGAGRIWRGARGTEPQSGAVVTPISPSDHSVVVPRSAPTQPRGVHAAVTPQTVEPVHIGPTGHIQSNRAPQGDAGRRPVTMRPAATPAPQPHVQSVGGRPVQAANGRYQAPRGNAAPRTAAVRPQSAPKSIAQVHNPYDQMGTQGSINMTPGRGQAQPGQQVVAAQVHAPQGFEPQTPGPQNTGVAQVHNPLVNPGGGVYHSPGVQEAHINRMPQGHGGSQAAHVSRPGAPHPTRPMGPGVVQGHRVGAAGAAPRQQVPRQPQRPVAQVSGAPGTFETPAAPAPTNNQMMGGASMQAAAIQPLVDPRAARTAEEMVAAVQQAATVQVEGLSPDQMQALYSPEPQMPQAPPPSAYDGTGTEPPSAPVQPVQGDGAPSADATPAESSAPVTEAQPEAAEPASATDSAAAHPPQQQVSQPQLQPQQQVPQQQVPWAMGTAAGAPMPSTNPRPSVRSASGVGHVPVAGAPIRTMQPPPFPGDGEEAPSPAPNTPLPMPGPAEA